MADLAVSAKVGFKRDRRPLRKRPERWARGQSSFGQLRFTRCRLLPSSLHYMACALPFQ